MAAWVMALIGLIVKIITGRGPSETVTESEKAGAEQSALATEESANAETTKAAAAVDAVGRKLESAGGLRDYEVADPNNRDNDKA